MKYKIFFKKKLITGSQQFIWCRLHMSICACFFLSCIMHAVAVHALFYYFHHFVDQPICVKKSKIITLSLLQSNQISHKLLEEKQLLKPLKKLQKKQNSKSTICVEKQVLNHSNNILHSDKNFPLVERNNINITKSTTPSVVSPTIYHDHPYGASCIINRIYPEYPNRARILGIEGKIIVQYNVNVNGRIDNICILSAVPVGIFEENIRSAMRRWVYESNKPEKNLIVTFKFCLNSRKTFVN
ncbi:TonB family protein [Blochmannia endosymbiont of Camponotus nipponensis]|uniref:TonB family protein n=1 Tax=Blochmannia endosymbiont of Camponotus nipponensis TaxID=2681986 RepID=UPI00135CC6C0|nr:TonB family protein [Blochmannia endosymbiont of Camponotus nipponensis]